jgi:hypothetical protein
MDKTIDHRIAWLAGIVDGEGWISVGVEGVPGRRKWSARRYIAARWQIGIANTDPAMLNEVMSIADILGAKCKFYDRADGPWRGNRKMQGRVAFETKDACATLLEALLPYLITKRARAILMLRAIEQRRRFGHCRSKNWTPVEGDFRFKAIVEEVHLLNLRGRQEGE